MLITRLAQSVDFERALKARSRVTTPHFALHHLHAQPVRGRPARPLAGGAENLSTTPLPGAAPLVEDSMRSSAADTPAGCWLGWVVPKRHAKRSVTRSLLKRLIRASVEGHAEHLSRGIWVVRLRAPFDRTHFVSAASDRLKRAARAELDRLFAKLPLGSPKAAT